MLGDCLLGVFLHLCADGRIDPEAVLVQVVPGSVRLAVLVQPSVKRIVSPENRVCGIVLPVGIF